MKSTKLCKVTFSRYRSFDKPQELFLKPITLLFGRNSAGKSSALRLIPIIASSMKDPENVGFGSIFNYDSPSMRGASYDDLAFNHESPSKMDIGMEWGDCRATYTTAKTSNSDPERIEQVVISVGDAKFTAKTNIEDDNLGVIDAEKSVNIGEIKLSGFYPKLVTGQDETLHDALHALSLALKATGRSTYWLGAVRAKVPRSFEVKRSAQPSISWDGSGTAELLFSDWQNGGKTAASVSDWLKRNVNCSLNFYSSSVTYFNRRELTPFDVISTSGASIAVRDVGEGVAQALPVITLCHHALNGELGETPILAFEQPELHLHPKAAVGLAHEVVDCVVKGSPATHLIETHSESMLLEIQIAIVEKKLRHEDVVIYWVSEENGASSLKRIDFDADGYPMSGWPQGVFREAEDQALKLSHLRLLKD